MTGLDGFPRRAPETVPGGQATGWHGRWLTLRNRFLSSRSVQHWAWGVPLFRSIARRRARRLFDLCAGFVYSQVLFACIDLDLFERLGGGPVSVQALASQLGLSLSATLRLLKSAESLDLVERTGEHHYALGRLGAALCGNPGIAGMVRHHAMLYRDLEDPVALLRGRRETRLRAYWPYADSARPQQLTAAHTSAYTALMADSQRLISGDILDAYSMKGHQRLLDLGGGSGAFLTAAADRWPALGLQLFDLPAVAGQARERFARDGLGHRAAAIGGDLFHDPLPVGADLISLVRVVHDHDDGPAMGLLRSVRRVLPDAGALLLAEPMSATPGAEPIGEAYFGFYLLAMGSGRPRTSAELSAMLHQAGFGRVREVPTRRPLLTRLLVANP